MHKPNLFIVGAPKCGTTSMYQYLKQHPQIYMADVKEPHYFSSDVMLPRVIRDEDMYMSLFSSVQREFIVGEASASYLYSELAARKIKDFSPDAYIIIILRNPVDMIYSLHSQRVYSGIEEEADFETALLFEHDRRMGKRHIKDDFFRYLSIGQFSQQVRRYLDAFGNDKVRVIIFDDFVRDTEDIHQNVLNFLGVDPEFMPSFSRANVNKEARLRALSLVTHKLKPRKGATLHPIRSPLVKILKKINTRKIPRKSLDPNIRVQLQKEFAPDIVKLSEILGRDLNYWSRIE